MIEPNLFGSLTLDTRERSAGSPTALGGSKGLRLQGATRITIDVDGEGRPTAAVVIPMCGFHRLEVPPAPIDEVERLVARRDRDGHEFDGPVVSTDPSPVEPEPDVPPFDPADLAGVVVDTYFNVDLQALVGLPIEAATYTVWFEFRGQRSNEHALELRLSP